MGLPRAPAPNVYLRQCDWRWVVSCCFHSVAKSAIDVRVVRQMIMVQHYS